MPKLDQPSRIHPFAKTLRRRLTLVGAVSSLGLIWVSAGCSSDPMMDDGTGGEATDSGGTTASGGVPNGTGGDESSGGVANTGGVATTGGNASTGGTASGGASGGTNSGGAASGGAASGGAGSGGDENFGGLGGLGGLGGMGGVPSVCDGCAVLFVPLAVEDTGTDFEIDYGDGGVVDLSATVVTARLRVETTGNSGGVQLYIKEGTAGNFDSVYSVWTNLTGAVDYITLTVNGNTAASGSFDPTIVRYVGINVAAGGQWGSAVWGDTTVYLDWIQFDTATPDDLFFTTGLEGIDINTYNFPLLGSDFWWEAP